MKIPLPICVLLLSLLGCDEVESRVASHAHGPHDGMLAPFHGGNTEGQLELKLHDDKGDLELWLVQAGRDSTDGADGSDSRNGKTLARPFDLPLDASLEIEFLDVGRLLVTLRPRDTSKNEDEDGNPNIRNGKTNYFIFPGETGEDASWLKGKDFRSHVIVRFTRDGTKFESLRLLLHPHSH